ncbi:MAG: hypothetical protein AB1428_13435 [Bacteroidota bacterium]
MTMNTRASVILAALACVIGTGSAQAQTNTELQHRRGRLWENVQNDGWIGSYGAWDYLTPAPLGLFPGFPDYNHPVGNEELALEQGYENSNFHDFRSGCWIVAKDLLTPGAPPTNTPLLTDYEFYASGLQAGTRGIEPTRTPLDMKKNYAERSGFDARLPEEMITATWNTNIGITVIRRSYVWSYPGYGDFIVYDYVFKNTGIMVSTLSSLVVPGFPQQTLRTVYFVFHSGISVSTKSQINFHSTLEAIQAGGFGWGGGKGGYPFHDYYHIEDGSTLVYSTNYNGGAAPLPPALDPFPTKPLSEIQVRFGPELQSPAAFGWLALYASPLVRGGPERATPKPDILRVDDHKRGTLQGAGLNLENFGPPGFKPRSFYQFATSPDTQAALGNPGNRMNFYTFSYGPYSLDPGDSVRFIVAEIAGVMDYNEVVAGDPDRHFPDSTIAAIRRNAQLARNAIRWGVGGNVDGMPLAAQVPPPPPPPPCDALNASLGLDTAVVAVTWTKVAESTSFTDGAGNSWFDGATDVDGYRVYRSQDFQYSGEGVLPAFRGAAWTLIADIPRAQFSSFFNSTESKYQFFDKNVKFGLRYGYYVSAYWSSPRPWVSANGTTVSTLPELASSEVNRSLPVTPAPGPVSTLKVFAAPNPYVFGDARRTFGSSNPYGIEFRNLPEKATIRIYTLAGDLVRILEHAPDARGNVYGSEVWDQKTDSGLLVAPGLYIYHVEPDVPGITGTFTGKLIIIR